MVIIGSRDMGEVMEMVILLLKSIGLEATGKNWKEKGCIIGI